MAELTTPRRKRFQRSDDPRPMQLTERDLQLLAHINRHRFLTSSQLAALDGGSPQNVLRCLRALFDHGFIDRPKAQLATLLVEGPRPMIYALAPKGARALREYGQELNGAGDWTEKNKRAGTVFVAHTLAVAEFFTALELSCRANPDVTLVREPEIIAAAPGETRRSREPLRWLAKPSQGRNEMWSVVPDGLFALSFSDGTASYFLLEIDRGTIPLKRHSLDHRSITRKLATYYEGWRAGRHVEQFGVKQLRVLVLTSSAARMRNMLSLVDDLTDGRGSGFFVFGHNELLGTTGPLNAVWTDGKRNAVKLTD